jgi:hypothetical protein
MEDHRSTHTDIDAIRRDMDASDRALSAAHDAPVHEAMDSVRWERRGLLQRLRRRP